MEWSWAKELTRRAAIRSLGTLCTLNFLFDIPGNCPNHTVQVQGDGCIPKGVHCLKLMVIREFIRLSVVGNRAIAQDEVKPGKE